MHLQLLGCFRFAVDSTVIDMPPVSAKVLAYLGIRGEETERSCVARTLWPGTCRARSLGNLRSALWRMPTCPRAAVRETGSRVGLHPAVRCDVDALVRQPAPTTAVGFADVLAWGWCDELLPGWYDDWVLAEREHLSLRRAAVLERLSDICCRSGLVADAVLYAAAAIGAQPLRESAHQALLRAHVAQGNLVEAHAHYDQLAGMLQRELGTDPSPETSGILADGDRGR
jgi:DNA-binding SARP family transcriptional activator